MSEMERIPLAKPELGEREEELVLEVLRSGRLSLGPMVERFEREFAIWLGVDDAVAVSSGTTALHLGARALGWGAGERIVTTPLSFVATANCLLYEGAEPVFCDIDPVTLNLDPAAAADALDNGAAGLLPVHIFGYPAAIAEIEALAAKYGVGLMEDACQAIGAVDSEGRPLGSRGNFATFAFYPNKQLATGEGGMLIPTDREAGARFRSERNQGRSPDMGVMDHDRLGFNYRLSDVAAAIGVAQLAHLDEMLAARASVAEMYTRRLTSAGAARAGEGNPDVLVLPCADRNEERRSWFVYVVQLPAGTQRREVIEGLAARGIEAKAYLPCIHLMPYYRERFGFRGGEFPVAEAIGERSVALPFFPSMSEEQVSRVCDLLLTTLN